MSQTQSNQIPIAIIGMGCIFAKSPDLKSYLRLVMDGIDGISDPPESRDHLRQLFDSDPKQADHIYCNRGGFLPYIDFDPTEFSIPPNVLEATDSSQLLGLLTAKKALEDAGYGPDQKTFDRRRTGVILGVTGTQELVIPLGSRLGHPLWRQAMASAGVSAETAEEVVRGIGESYVQWQENSFPGLLGNVVAGRIANRLDLSGTNCVVDAACASSLAAVNLALLELQTGRADMIISGGVDTINDPFMYMCFAKTQILSPSGDVRPFSEQADGTILGEGIGLLVLKRLADAQRDNDRIYAVIRGIGTGSDGKSQSIYAPSPDGQAQTLLRAYENAGLDPARVGLIEAHGTGTRIGDQVEFQALRQVFHAAETDKKISKIALGSIKSNIGHTKAAAGAAGLIKASLALYHKMLPPTLKAEKIDPRLEINHTPFYINQAQRPWITSGHCKRAAGVSAFGFGGSNFHVVLEEYQTDKPGISWDGGVEIVALSAESRQALAEKVSQWRQKAETPDHPNAFSGIAVESRRKFQNLQANRLVMVLQPPFDAALIRQYHDAACDLIYHPGQRQPTLTERLFYGEGSRTGDMAFLFPGQGSQYVGMGRDIVCRFPASHEIITEAAAGIDADPGLIECIYPTLLTDKVANEDRLRKTDVAQPAIGAVSAAMHAVLAYFDIRPDAFCGHSYGELSALYAAGWLTRTDFWRLSIARGALMAAACNKNGGSGSMLAVMAPIMELKKLVPSESDDLSIANYNAPEQGVLSGTTAAIDQVQGLCNKRGWKSIRLPVAGAFHSRLMAEPCREFQRLINQINFHPDKLPVMSNALADAYLQDPHRIQKTLGKQLGHPVHFISNIENLYQKGIRTFVEVGPKSILTGLVKSILGSRPHQAIAMDRSAGRQSGILDLAACLGELSAGGFAVDLKRWEDSISNPDSRPKMRIAISGANYRSAKTSTMAPFRKSVTPPLSVTKLPVKPTAASASVPTAPSAQAMASLTTNSGSVAATIPEYADTKMKPYPPTGHLGQILATVQQGLASMQALQAQTAQAHQKFLEVQAEANRAVAAMIQNARFFAEGKIEVESIEGSPDREDRILPSQSDFGHDLSKADTAIVPSHDFLANPATTDELSSQKQTQMPVPEKPVSSGQQTNSQSQSSAIQKAVLGIVADLTGYPEQMLGMEMDIESDLGIDSIKRVEILSAVEEKMPELPKVTPDMLGDLKTLGQICTYLAEGRDRPAQANLPGIFMESDPAACNQSVAVTVAPGTEDQSPEISKAVLAIVAELTGYPEQMLGMEMDIESDLGIDSIKRVEILSAVEEKMPELPKVTPDMLGDLKTLGQICAYLAEGRGRPVQIPSDPITNRAPAHAIDRPADVRPDRFVVVPEILPPLKSDFSRISLNNPQQVLIVSEANEFAELLATQLHVNGYKTRVVSNDETPQPIDMTAGLILISPILPRNAFGWAHACGPELCKMAAQNHAFFSSVSFLDGAFGFNNGELHDPMQGALAGLVKTAALEWPTVHCRALDVDPAWKDLKQASIAAIAEMLLKDSGVPVEIGLSATCRSGMKLVPAPLAGNQPVDLSPHEVVVVTGGGRGITAFAAKALALQSHCRLALLGRTAEPQPEPDWLAGLSDPEQIKKAIYSRGFTDQVPTPLELENCFRAWKANRDIKKTLADLSATGITARYFSVDIRRPAELQTILRLIRNELGPVRALIHGAGVLEDRLIQDKTIAQFNHVFDTKVDGFEHIIQATAADDLRYITIFSSISGRLGNIGQSDYAMANEALNKMARRQSRRRPECKVVSINWGPWDGGMVSDSLKRHFSGQGVSLITLEQGARAMIEEMAASADNPTEVIIGSHFSKDRPPVAVLPDRDSPLPACKPGAALNLAATRQITLKDYPVLQSHFLDGRPVVPLALIAEWLAQGALHANPGLLLHGIDDLRLFKGISLDASTKSISLMTGVPRRNGNLFEVNVELHDADGMLKQSIHSCATAILTDRLPSPPKFEENGHFRTVRATKSPEYYYRNVLFQGEALKGLKNIIRISNQGITATIDSAPVPQQWISEPWRNYWILDPLVLDCAFQMAIIWSYEQLGHLSLPNYVKGYRQYCNRFPSRGVTAVLEVLKTTTRKITGRFVFLDEDKHVVARLEGFEGLVDRNLSKAFMAAESHSPIRFSLDNCDHLTKDATPIKS